MIFSIGNGAFLGRALVKLFVLSLFSLTTFAFTCATGEGDSSKGNKAHDKLTVIIDDLGVQRIWNKRDRLDLTYCVSERFKELKPLILSALKMATDDWMETANVSFRYVPDADKSCDQRGGPSTRFRIAISTSRRYPYAARAFFPYDERKTVTFKKSYVEKSFQEVLRLVRHELGHVLGLRHEHIRRENPLHKQCAEDDLFKPITDYDRGSIMHYSHCGGTGAVNLSAMDRIGIGQLYPY